MKSGFPANGSFKVRGSDNWIRWTVGHLNRAIEQNLPPPHLPNQTEVWDPIQIKQIFTREKFSTGCVIGKRSLHVSRLTVSEFSDQGTKGVSVKEGGNVKGGRREGGISRKGGRRSTGEKHFPADQVLIGGSSLGICFKTYLWTHFQ